MKPKRILYFHSGADLYGASRSLLRLTSRLIKDGYALLVIIPDKGPLAEKLEQAEIPFLVHNRMPVITRQKFGTLHGIVSLFSDSLLSIVKYWRFITQFNPDIIHTNTAVIFTPGILAKLFGISHCWHIREFFVEFPIFWKFYQWWIYVFSDKILCVSRSVSQQFSKRLQGKIKILNNGFPANEFLVADQIRVEKFCKTFGLSADGCKVGVIGRIKFKRKGQEVFVHAIKKIHEKFPETHFLCIGSPFPGNEGHLEELKNLICKLGLEERIIYTGDVEDILAAYTALDIVVLPSVQPEPFGGVVIEAMAMEKPVIGTCIGGTVEQIANGSTGILVEPGDDDDLADAIDLLLSKPELRFQYGRNGKKKFLDCFEFEKFYNILITIYQSLPN